MPIPTFRAVLDRITPVFRAQGALAAILVDLSDLARIERAFGEKTYQALRAQIEPLMEDLRAQVREGDLLTRDEAQGDRYIFFMQGPRQPTRPFAVKDLRPLVDRMQDFLRPKVARLALPYLKDRPSVDVGYGFVLHTPLESEERQVLRLIREAEASADLRRQLRAREEREGLLEIIHNRKVWTAFQPIVEMPSRQPMGYEALSRGPRGTDLESPGALFGLAGRQGLVEELERSCRRQTFEDWTTFGAPARLFLNTVPATIRDPSFLGRGVFDYLGPDLSPRFVTLEITEGQVIENITLYREAMHSFIEMGFSFAIDDLGAGYSGLENLATLGASYLKIDMGLVRDVHQKKVNQQVVRAILDMAREAGATVIAEGIETEPEAEVLQSLGVRFAQGYLFGRPLDPAAPRPASARQAR